MPYTALVLTKESHNIICEKAKDYINLDILGKNGWEIIAHHMTICMGEPDQKLKLYLGYTYKVEINGFGFSENSIAFRVPKASSAGVISINSTPHVTVAVNREIGAKPYDSNKIKFWIPLDTFEIDAILEIVK